MIKTGTPRAGVYCKICKKTYLDPCVTHSDPNIAFLLKEDKWGVFYLKRKKDGKTIGVEIITQNPTGGHKVTFKGKDFEIIIEDWINEPIPDDIKSDKK